MTKTIILILISNLLSQNFHWTDRTLSCATDNMNNSFLLSDYLYLQNQRQIVYNSINNKLFKDNFEMLYIPIVFHNYYSISDEKISKSFCDYQSGNNENGLYTTENDSIICIERVNNVLDLLNNQFQAKGIQFIAPIDTPIVVNDIKNDEEVIYNYNWNSIKNKYHIHNKLNIYLDYCIGRENSSSGILECSTIEGWSSYPHNISSNSHMGIAIKHSAFPGLNNNTIGLLAHEIGHVFSLLHLYHLPVPKNDDGLYQVSNDYKRELVNGTECNIRGDLICDTPGQPLQDVDQTFDTDECIYHGFNGEYNSNSKNLKIGGSEHIGSFRPDFDDYTNIIAHNNFDENGKFWGTMAIPDSCFLINQDDYSTSCIDSNYKYLPIANNYLQWSSVMNQCTDDQKNGFTSEQIANIKYSLENDYTACSSLKACNTGYSNRLTIPKSNLLIQGETSCRFPCSKDGGCTLTDLEYVDNHDLYNCGGNLVTLDIKNFLKNIELIKLYPNPFNTTIFLKYNLIKSLNIQISIYDLNGKLVTNLVDDFQLQGYHTAYWDASNFSSGIYFIKINSNQSSQINKIIHIK